MEIRPVDTVHLSCAVHGKLPDANGVTYGYAITNHRKDLNCYADIHAEPEPEMPIVREMRELFEKRKSK
jgi:hypothetical protein